MIRVELPRLHLQWILVTTVAWVTVISPGVAGKCPDWYTILSNEGVPPPPPAPFFEDGFGINPIKIGTPHGTMYLPDTYYGTQEAPVGAGGAQGLGVPSLGRPRRVVINFARGCCRVAQARNCISALRHGADMCIALNESAISAPFARRNAGTLALGRGAGYWLWKLHVILRTLMRLDENDMVLYSDSAQDFVDDVGPLFDAAAGEQAIALGFAQWYKNKNWVKRDAFLLLGCTNETLCTGSQQVQASVLVFRKTEAALVILTKWLAYAQDPRALTDMANTLGAPNYYPVTWHRHDQSILSLLAAMYGLHGMNAYHDRVEGLEFNCTVQHHRLRI